MRENPFAATEEAVKEEQQEAAVDQGNADILERIIRLAAESYDKDPASLSAATNFREDLNAKSVVFVGFAAKLEDEFDILIPMTDAFASKTLGGLAELVEREMKNQ
ncbi:MAG: acyl carrier protein [Lachnospiraceae bacterium]|nr:acyl carrier protein [Lachnospiraceae bacterium]MDO4733682.1 acyl carrier protein [Lachnospiraceae bacterium]